MPIPRRPLLCALGLLLASCAGRTPIDTGAATAGASEDLVDLPFFTNRAIETGRGERRYFGRRIGDLAAGTCYVRVDDGDHADERDAELVRVATGSADELFSDLDAHAERGIVVYVHGYNMSFERSCRHAATLRRRLGIPGGLLLFTWPADSAIFTYRSDVADVRASADTLFALLDDLGERYGRERVSIVAHSLGSRGVLDSLAAWQPGDDRFARLILIAADVDREPFRRALPELKRRIDAITLIVSGRDRTLLVSQLLHLAPRLGQSDGVDIEGVDVVDVTAIEGSTGHMYHLRNDRVAELIRSRLYGDSGP